MVSTKLLSSTTIFNIDNNKKCFLSRKINHSRMISEGLCDTENLSNDAENSNDILRYIQLEKLFLF